MSDTKVDLYKKFSVPEPQAFGTNLELLIVDPQSDVRLILTHHLQKLGFAKVRVVREGVSALVEIRRQPASIILISNELEGPSAHDVIQEIREDVAIQRDVVVLCSTPLNRQQVMYALENGFDDFLIKPVIPNEIMPKLRTAHAAFANHRNPERIYEFAKFALRMRELEQAKNVYNELALQTTHAARPYVGLARVAQMEGNLALALQYAQIAIQKNDKYTHAFALLGELHIETGDLDSAFKFFKQAITLSPLNVIRYERAAEVLLKAGRVDDTIEMLSIGTEAGFQHPFIIERLGYCYFQKKDYQKAAKFLRQAVHAEPDSLSFLNSLAICYRDAQMYDEALETYNRIIKKDNENHLVMFNKSLVLNLMGRKEDAVKLLKKIVAKNPDFQKAKDKIIELTGSLD